MINPKRTKSAKFIAKHWTDQLYIIFDETGKSVTATQYLDCVYPLIEKHIHELRGCLVSKFIEHRVEITTREDFVFLDGKLIKVEPN